MKSEKRKPTKGRKLIAQDLNGATNLSIMKSKFLKPTIGVVCAMAFFIMSSTSVNAHESLSENQVTVSNLAASQDLALASDWWVLASSNWVLAGPGK